MKEISNPLDYLIELCEKAADYGTITQFTIRNAKDELKRLRQEAEQNAVYKNIAWASINGKGDIFNLTMIYNEHWDQDTIIPLYNNEKEYKEKYGKLSK